MNKLELKWLREGSKNQVADFVRSESGWVGIKNAATIGAFVGGFALSQIPSEAILDNNGNIVEIKVEPTI